MAQKTNLNVSPYYDDFDTSKNFHKVLYRPGFAVQARDLTSQQSILQNQVEEMGRNIFKEGAIISGGEVGMDKQYYAVKIQGTFNTTDITSNISSYKDKIITGATSGVAATVVGTADASGDDPITLFVKYLNPDLTGEQFVFTDGENLFADGAIGSFIAGQESLTIQSSDATAIGSAVTVAAGTYFVRGHFVNVSEQTLVLDKYGNTPSYRIGFTVTEDLVTPEEDTTLYDNATGTSNENAANATFTVSLSGTSTENITVDQSGNNLLVSASPKKINEIREIVKEVDIPTTQIMLEARLIEVTLGDQEEMGFDWERLAKTTLIFAEQTDPVRMGDNLTYNGQLPGSTPTLNTPTGGEQYITEDFGGLPLGLLPQQMPYTRNLDNINPFGRQLTAFDVTLDMLLKDNQADILTNSQVVTVNGQEATIEMVDVIPYLASSGGIGGQMQILKETVGIKLHILPYVNSDGYITTEITPELSSIISWTSQGYPWTKKRTSTTTVRVLDGETIVIAGLVTTEEVEVRSKVPVLWRIPIIGKRWFSHNEISEKKTDLIIQVKPTIVVDNYSGIDKKEYHIDAEESIINE